MDPLITLRKATMEDIPRLELLISESVRVLSRQDYTAEQIEAALGGAFGVDSELIHDQTYFVAEAGAELVGSGGWSRRQTLFGGDAQPDRRSALLNPESDAARIRAFFIRPAWARRKIGRSLLERCELEARAEGFRATELVATLSGHRLYKACGYFGEDRVRYALRDGVTIEFIPMRKEL